MALPELNEFNDSLSNMQGVNSLEVCLPGGGLLHVMNGIPTWLGMLGIALIVVVSHIFINTRKTLPEDNKAYWSFNLLKFKPVAKLVKLPQFPMIMQTLSLLSFILVLSAGFWGNPYSNIAPVLTWTWWWVLLIFMIMGMGKFFCMICPWEALTSIVTSLSLKSRVKKLGFEYKWPKWAKNIYPAIIFFILLTWFELGWNATRSPMMTATMGVIMAGMAVLAAILFEKRAFCRYACLVGRVSGLYSLFSPVELRSQSEDICASCKTKDCYKGSHVTTMCPTGLFPSKIDENTYCTMCTECVRSCPHDNIGINIRPVAKDLFRKRKFQWDEAFLAIVLLSMTSFHGLTMTPQWLRINEIIRGFTGFGPTLTFTILMGVMLLVPYLMFWYGAQIAKFFSKSDVSSHDIFKAFAYSLIPIALFYHIAHNCMHFFMEAQHIIPLLSDPFGWGWDLFGTAGKSYPPLLTLSSIWYMQVFAIVFGHILGVILADRYAKRLFSQHGQMIRALIPLIIVMILYSAFSIWLIMQPMEMRSAM